MPRQHSHILLLILQNTSSIIMTFHLIDNMDCNICKKISILCGKRLFMPLLGHRYPLLALATVEPHTEGLDLSIGGGLRTRGWTYNDVDVNGSRTDAAQLDKRLKKNGIPHPIHYCGPRIGHSHLRCALYGIKLALTGKGY